MPIASPVCGDFEEDFRTPLYDEYKDIWLEERGIKWDVSSFVSNLESLYQKDPSSLDSLKILPMKCRRESRVCTLLFRMRQ